MKAFQHYPKARFERVLPLTACAARMMTIGLVFACMLWLGIRAYSVGVEARQWPVLEGSRFSDELAWAEGSQIGQFVVDRSPVRVNIEAYNKKREKDIADASGKLLTLAIALRAEIERDSASGTSPNTARKVKEIEKLAHDVKEMMRINMVGP